MLLLLQLIWNKATYFGSPHPEEVSLSLLDSDGKASSSTVRESNSVFTFTHAHRAIRLSWGLAVSAHCG